MNKSLIERILSIAGGRNLYLHSSDFKRVLGVKFDLEKLYTFRGKELTIKGGFVPGDQLNGKMTEYHSNKIVCVDKKKDDYVISLSFGTDGIKLSVQYRKNETIDACWHRAYNFDTPGNDPRALEDFIIKEETDVE